MKSLCCTPETCYMLIIPQLKKINHHSHHERSQIENKTHHTEEDRMEKILLEKMSQRPDKDIPEA